MIDVDLLHVQEIAANVYTGSNFETAREKGHLSQDGFVKKGV